MLALTSQRMLSTGTASLSNPLPPAPSGKSAAMIQSQCGFIKAKSCLANLLLWQDYLIVDKGKNMYLFLFLLRLFVLFSDYNEVLILSLTVSFWIKYPVYS